MNAANATHTHPELGHVELRGTRRVGRGKKSRTVALVYGPNGNQQVELATLTPIPRRTKNNGPSLNGQSAGWIRRGPARTERSALRLETRDRSRLGCSGSGAARQALEAARAIAPECLRDMEPKAAPILQFRSQDRDELGIKARISALLIDRLRDGTITVEQALKIAAQNGIDARY
jgi:hypothetical protein